MRSVRDKYYAYRKVPSRAAKAPRVRGESWCAGWPLNQTQSYRERILTYFFEVQAQALYAAVPAPVPQQNYALAL